jgi:hypothetical protein
MTLPGSTILGGLIPNFIIHQISRHLCCCHSAATSPSGGRLGRFHFLKVLMLLPASAYICRRRLLRSAWIVIRPFTHFSINASGVW